MVRAGAKVNRHSASKAIVRTSLSGYDNYLCLSAYAVYACAGSRMHENVQNLLRIRDRVLHVVLYSN